MTAAATKKYETVRRSTVSALPHRPPRSTHQAPSSSVCTRAPKRLVAALEELLVAPDLGHDAFAHLSARTGPALVFSQVETVL
ncbi:hypothetical protein [Streptomyces sp. NPDC000188]|uniref:hypothetical protein n=1 Tax=Streptomyces sp. NPDC000188 TaxID=3154245 RepID=UPI00332DD863